MSGDGHAAEHLSRRQRRFARAARRITVCTGSPWAVVVVVAGLVVWLGAGWASGFSRIWELAVTVGVPLITLVLLIVVQHTQNHDDAAIQLKLDEVISALDRASDSMVRVEEGSGEDLDRLRHHYRRKLPSDGDVRQAGDEPADG